MTSGPVGSVTRGTTHPNRLRRVDRWLAGVLGGRLRRMGEVAVVDLGFGASPVTTVELAHRLARVAPQAQVVGLEIDPGRVAVASARHPAVAFDLGGFELGRYALRTGLVRACNVLRQYDEADAAEAWRTMLAGCARGGVVVEGTCDEIGRRSSWVLLDRRHSDVEPVSLTLSLRLAGLERPSEVAARLPKALIHHNVPGQPVHRFLAALDAGWAAAAPWGAMSARQRWMHTARAAQQAGFHLLDGPGRWRLGEITVRWRDVAPLR